MELNEVNNEAAQEESSFKQAKEAVAAIQVDHPQLYDQHNCCAMAVDGTMKLIKLPMLWHTCEDLCLDIPSTLICKKALNLAQLKPITTKINVIAKTTVILSLHFLPICPGQESVEEED